MTILYVLSGLVAQASISGPVALSGYIPAIYKTHGECLEHKETTEKRDSPKYAYVFLECSKVEVKK